MLGRRHILTLLILLSICSAHAQDEDKQISEKSIIVSEGTLISTDAENKTYRVGGETRDLETLQTGNPGMGFFKIQRYSDSELSLEALRVSANCQPIDTNLNKGVIATPDDDSFFIIPFTQTALPPYPTVGGDLTIAGVDSNSNCVRDDTEHFIFELFGEEDEHEIRQHLYSHAIWLTFFLSENPTPKEIQSIARESGRTLICINDFLGKEDSKIVTDKLFGQVHDTDARTRRYFDNRSGLQGYVVESAVTPNC